VSGFFKIAAALHIGLAAGLAAAAPQTTVTHKTYEHFRGGEKENVALIGRGALELGPEFKLSKAIKPQAFIWALAADSKGRVYAATGHNGTVFALEDKTARVALETDDLEVLSLAIDGKDAVYAACAPSGKIYRIPRVGKPVLFCETQQTYVWALAFSAGGDLYAATGPEGKVLRINGRTGAVQTVLDSDDTHILGLAVAGDALYATTDKSGLVYRIAKDDRVSIAFDSPRAELRCIAADDKGNVYFGSADGVRASTTAVPSRVAPSRPAPSGKPGGAAAATVKDTARTSKRPPTYVPSKRGAALNVSGTNYVYRLSPDGKVATLFQMSGVAFLSMCWHRGALYVGTAGEGQVFRILSERDTALIAEQDQPQILSICALPGGTLLLGTGNDGRIYSAASDRASKGVFTSRVIDARFRAAWGAFQVQATAPGGTAVELSTRSGNSAKPDDTWSAWAKPRGIDARLPAQSPAARFLQYRLLLSTRRADRSPRVRSVCVPYLVDNYPPSIDSIDVGSAAKADAGKRPAAKAPAKPAPNAGNGWLSGSVAVTWKAHDQNGDQLEFSVHFRGEGEAAWKQLKDKLKTARCVWDTEAVPDGVYELKVIASDRAQNPPPRTLTDELVSEPVTVDNSPPTVKIVRRATKDGKCSIQAEAKDAGSNIVSAGYSVDAGAWQPLLSVDRIFDAASERLEFSTGKLAAGEHTLVIRAYDSAGNSGAVKTVFEVPRQ